MATAMTNVRRLVPKLRWYPLLDTKWAFRGQTGGTEGYGVIAFL